MESCRGASATIGQWEWADVIIVEKTKSPHCNYSLM
jgi:hypothetical protein